MGRLWTKAAECEYKEYDRLLTQYFIGGLNDEDMIGEILRGSSNTRGHLGCHECAFAYVDTE